MKLNETLIFLLASILLLHLFPACLPDVPKRMEETGAIILGGQESCLKCHSDYTGFAMAHNPQSIGCTSCHLGNPAASTQDSAHLGMVLVPGNLSNVRQTCATANCHAAIADRVENSLMNTMAGVVAVDRYVFGAADTLSAWHNVHQIGHTQAVDVHLRQLCASCHLGNDKSKPGPASESSRGGGCVACHLDYSGASQVKAGSKFHPAINLQVGNEHCFGCHSRSGRISTNYEGWHETRFTPKDVQGKKRFRQLEDGRIFQQIAADVHHQKGLDCIDCHSATEIMGDGQRYFHEEEAVVVQCSDCHFKGTPSGLPFDGLSIEDQKILLLRRAKYRDATFLVGKKSGKAISNVFIDQNGKPQMASKNSGKRHPLKPPASVCTRGTAHQDLTCSTCHSGWAPQCIGCHNSFEPETMAYDLLDKKMVKGKWTEHLGEFFAEAPSLGVRENKNGRRVQPFIPGMALSIDFKGFPGMEAEPPIQRRLFAPAAPHTTTSKGRDCRSCHCDPVALGYGRGTLEYKIKGTEGEWVFESTYASDPADGLPQDAWIAFLTTPPNGGVTTRPDARPFNLEEQQKILLVGACLQCHREQSKTMGRCLDDFDGMLQKRSKKCVLPGWVK